MEEEILEKVSTEKLQVLSLGMSQHGESNLRSFSQADR
jgi:hypothetical protein